MIFTIISIIFASLAQFFVNGQVYLAQLSGQQEIPPVETSASGNAWIDTTLGQGVVLFNLSAYSLLWPVAGHLHYGPVGVEGSTIYPIFHAPPIFAGNIYYLTLLTDDDLQNPDNASPLKTIDDFLQALQGGNIYVNIHTKAPFYSNLQLGQSGDNPFGEIRGQFLPWSSVSSTYTSTITSTYTIPTVTLVTSVIVPTYFPTSTYATVTTSTYTTTSYITQGTTVISSIYVTTTTYSTTRTVTYTTPTSYTTTSYNTSTTSYSSSSTYNTTASSYSTPSSTTYSSTSYSTPSSSTTYSSTSYSTPSSSTTYSSTTPSFTRTFPTTIVTPTLTSSTRTFPTSIVTTPLTPSTSTRTLPTSILTPRKKVRI